MRCERRILRGAPKMNKKNRPQKKQVSSIPNLSVTGSAPSLSQRQINNILKHLVGKPVSRAGKKKNVVKKEKTNCFHCQEPIDKRKRGFIEVVKRTELALDDCLRICFHMQCWTDAAGESFTIK